MMTNHDIAKNLNMQSINKGNHLQVSWSNRYIHYYYLEYVQWYLRPTAVNSSLLLFSDDHMYFDLNMDNITYTSRPATIYQMSATSILFTQRGIKKILREILVHTTGTVVHTPGKNKLFRKIEFWTNNRLHEKRGKKISVVKY